MFNKSIFKFACANLSDNSLCLSTISISSYPHIEMP